MAAIMNRYDFVFLFDVKDGNPNGDPDQDNLPRTDAETQFGFVTDVCIKRKVRNYVMLKKNRVTEGEYNPEPGYDIFIRQGNVLNPIIENAKGDDIPSRQGSLVSNYFDIRTFGAVLTTGKKASGTIRGPVQFTFSRSIDRVFQAEHSITRCVVTTEKEQKQQEKRENASTFGRKSTIPYALYRMHGFVSVVDAKKTGFSDEDLELLWESLINAFEHDRSAARGEMNPRKLFIFKHESYLGNARSGQLFDLVKINKLVDLPRNWSDYRVDFDINSMPKGVSLDKKHSLL
ncbi:MAG: type I-C CRISPR-associated protein Cas7/Csd2 [Dysgonamonadaceae bacterium]|jgi:CRISPR-associated protein Csd2|nr:type I-C CRISPR-associated protein Cas7/Csd2 [Dysgonamonadaceae bacterium]